MYSTGQVCAKFYKALKKHKAKRKVKDAEWAETDAGSKRNGNEAGVKKEKISTVQLKHKTASIQLRCSYQTKVQYSVTNREMRSVEQMMDDF